MDIIINNPNKPWNWNFISYNPNITMEIISNNPDIPWDWNVISCNPNLTIKMIDDYQTKIRIGKIFHVILI